MRAAEASFQSINNPPVSCAEFGHTPGITKYTHIMTYYDHTALVTTDDGKHQTTHHLVADVYDSCQSALTAAETHLADLCLDYTTTGITATKYANIYDGQKDDDKDLYEVKVIWLLIDDKTGKLKKTPALYGIWADSVKDAEEGINRALTATLMDYRIAHIKITQYEDLIK